MSASGTHRNLAVWKRAIALAGKVYAATRALPSDEPFALQQQLRSAALAVPVHIAAGCARCNRIERIQCLQLARAALYETETRILFALEQGLLASCQATVTNTGRGNVDDIAADIAALARQLDALIQGVATARLAAHAQACKPPGSTH
jgi:four helix bundle protein